MFHLLRLLGRLALVSLLALPGAAVAEPEPLAGYSPRAAVQGERWMISAAHPLAASAGAALLARGGSALDAAIAAQLVLNVVEPQSSGIGGGGFLLYWTERSRRLSAWDGRETAPAAARPERFLDESGRPSDFAHFLHTVTDARSVGVPGLLRMLEEAHAVHGRLPWRDLFAPAIRLAREGWPVSRRTHALLALLKPFAHDEAARKLWFDADGAPLPAGAMVMNRELAASFARIAAGGASAFYSGDIARDIVARLRAADPAADMTEADLANYRAIEREALCTGYRGRRVCGMPPPSSGGITLGQMLGLLERAGFAAAKPRSAQALHLFAEAGRLAYADRERWIADPAFAAVPAAGLLDPRYLDARATLIQPRRAMGRAAAGLPPGVVHEYGEGDSGERGGTTHISVVDARGNAAALTSSIEFAFGSQFMVRGFLLNNQLTDFAWTPDRDGRPLANRVEGGKRPRSAMSPTMVFDVDGKLQLVAGSAGGPAIVNHVARTVAAVIDWNLDAQAALDLPHFGSRGGATELERGRAPKDWSEGLRALGHELRLGDMNSGLHVIQRTPRGWLGAADPRREGGAVGR